MGGEWCSEGHMVVWNRCSAVMGGAGTMRPHSMWCSVHFTGCKSGQESEIHHATINPLVIHAAAAPEQLVRRLPDRSPRLAPEERPAPLVRLFW